MYELGKNLLDRYRVIILAPGASNAKSIEIMEGLQVVRFRYFFQGGEKLAYGGGILASLKSNPLNYVLVPFFIFFQLVALISLVRREQVDLIHAHWIIPQGLVVWIFSLIYWKAIPVLITSHGGDLYGLKGRISGLIKKIVLLACQGITVVSSSMKETLMAMGIAEKKIKVISMGVDLTSIFTPAQDHVRAKKEILFVGRLVEKKGLVDLIHAFKLVIKEINDAKLIIVGDGPQRLLLEDTSRELNLGDSISFIGAVTKQDLVEYYRQSAVAVFPFVVARDGDQEGLGLVVIEALGCECPVIASGLDAVKDILVHEQNGLLTRPGDRGGMANAIIKILREPEWARSLAKKGRQDVLKKFGWEIITDRYKEVIDELIIGRVKGRIND